MAIERDPARVSTGGLAGLLGATFSPIPPTPADEQRRAAAPAASAANSGQIVNIPSFKPTGVTILPSPLLVRPETVSRRYFRGRAEESFGPGNKLDEVLNRIGQIVREQAEQALQSEQDKTPTISPYQSGEAPDKAPATSPFDEAPIATLPPAEPQTQVGPGNLPPVWSGNLPPVIVMQPHPFVPPPPPPPQYPQTWGGWEGGREPEGPAMPEPSGPSPSGPSQSGPSTTGPSSTGPGTLGLDLTFEAGNWDRSWGRDWDLDWGRDWSGGWGGRWI